MKRIHYYHADATTFGGALDKPFNAIVDSSPQVSLPSVGGFKSATQDALNFENLFSYKSASTQTSGGVNQKTGGWTTQVSVSVEGLNLLQVVTADRAVAQITVDHPPVGYVPSVTFLGSQFVNLRIAGKPVDVIINPKILQPSLAHTISSNDTPELPVARIPWLRNPAFLGTIREQVKGLSAGAPVPDWLQGRYDWVETDEGIDERGFAICSLVDNLHGDLPQAAFGHAIELPEFGKFFFGEVLFSSGSFQLTMVRAELGSPVAGSVGVATGRTNGHTMP